MESKNIHSNTRFTRRNMISVGGYGLGALALSSLCSSERVQATPVVPRNTTHAKSVIWVVMNGGQSHVDTWDYKPQLAKSHGKKLAGFDNAVGFFPEKVGAIMQSPFSFKQYGECGKWVSDIFPHLTRHVDDMAFVHSCHGKSNNHSPALFTLNTGVSRMGYPCVGSWVTYGLGSENNNLPSFVVMTDPKGRGLPKGQAQNWGAGFLPGSFQGTALNNSGQPINDLNRIANISDRQQRRQLDFLNTLNREHQKSRATNVELESRIRSFELAYRMQTAAPEVFDLNRESPATHHMYGLDDQRCAHFGRQCLYARRMVESGVRFVQLYSGGTENQKSWDGHADIEGNHRGFAGEVDQPIAALLIDLKQRGLLEETLVVCGGEFGRLPIAQLESKPGRDHNPNAFTTWFAGGGIKGGISHGETDELGLNATIDKVSVHDLHATILHLLGVDHERLKYNINGLDVKLTGVEGAKVISQIL
ncbi:MAG: DUF1501 domain-containing protein [Planctomycetaceae bacterium]|nr:DUF1501 domain-containing protein [Planctomycetaceae bacterium]